jgi:hypothetical protein
VIRQISKQLNLNVNKATYGLILDKDDKMPQRPLADLEQALGVITATMFWSGTFIALWVNDNKEQYLSVDANLNSGPSSRLSRQVLANILVDQRSRLVVRILRFSLLRKHADYCGNLSSESSV